MKVRDLPVRTVVGWRTRAAEVALVRRFSGFERGREAGQRAAAAKRRGKGHS